MVEGLLPGQRAVYAHTHTHTHTVTAKTDKVMSGDEYETAV